MNIKSYNKSLCEQCKKALNFAFINQPEQGDSEVFFSSDTDNVRYTVTAITKKVSVVFSCVDLEVIWNFANKHMIANYYNQFQVKLINHNGKKAIQLSINNDSLTRINQQYKPKPETGITTGKKPLEDVFDYISKKLASIKRHFYASPFQMFLETVAYNYQNKQSPKTLPNLSFYFKENKAEKVWLAFEKDQFTVYYGISFENRQEQQLCRILFLELVDAKKHVQNSPNVGLTESELPQLLIQSFPQEKTVKYNFANGILSFTLYGKLVRNPRGMATYLGGFRTYAYYHIQASKCYLHSRVLRRIQKCYKDLNESQLEQTSQK